MPCRRRETSCNRRQLTYTERDDNLCKEPNKDIHKAYLDVIKTYDNAWVDVIMYVI